MVHTPLRHPAAVFVIPELIPVSTRLVRRSEMVLNFFFNCLISTLHPSAHRAIFVTTHYSLLTNH
ncbi:hypothetical protein OMAG_002580 [Candidatus Omnitrophus magneticus]|uniref:Uncharacterized protein n=1 Tax=Candidatus Omnitrophus magneticus TaxID=1609969 RepID=A0A0F0CQ49_9BACT|nr:hypothetical protein OMAG_002580 [Candidatus Omnitrophus magneticus]